MRGRLCLFLEARLPCVLTNIAPCVSDLECPSPELTSAGEARGSLCQTRSVGPRHQPFGVNGTPVSLSCSSSVVMTSGHVCGAKSACWWCSGRNSMQPTLRSAVLRSWQPSRGGGRRCWVWPRSKQWCMSSLLFLRVLLPRWVVTALQRKSRNNALLGFFFLQSRSADILDFENVARQCCDNAWHGRVVHNTASIGTSVRRHGQGYRGTAGALL
jgi:hypothetical protein